MAAALTITPASGTIRAKIDTGRVDVTGASSNDTSSYDAEADQAAGTPTEDEIRYRIVASADGEQDLVSEEFAVGSDGKHTWYGPVFPAAGSWTLDLVNQADDSVDATLAVTVA